MKIKYKLLITFGLLILMSFAIVGINYLTYETLGSDANVINYSGRLRAASYRMAQLGNMIISSGDSEDINALNGGIKNFDKLLSDINTGNEEEGLVEITHKATIDKLKLINEKWNKEFKPAYESILISNDSSSLTLINAEVPGYVDSINELVTGYSKYSSSKVVTAKVTNGILILIILIIGLLSFAMLNKGIRQPIATLNDSLKDLSQGDGDLTKRIKVTSKDEIGEMTTYFNLFIGNIHEIVKDISNISISLSQNMEAIADTTEELTKSTELIAMSSMDVAEGSSLQGDKLGKLNDYVEKIKLDIESVSHKALETLNSSQESQTSVDKGNSQVVSQAADLNEFVSSIEEASHNVEDLNQSSEEIKAIVELIHSISSQTNLLALNASIEAARAGEAGRGFAVVADEIRKLAEETSVSAEQISNIVSSISDKTVNVKLSMDELVDKTRLQEKSMDLLKEDLKDILSRTTVTLDESKGIMEISTKVNDDFSEITHSAKDIQDVAIQNSNNTQDVAAAVEEQTASFEEVSSNISSINEMSNDLINIVGKFKI